MNYEQQAAMDFAQRARKLGFSVFIAERGNYGYYTDGKRVVSFQYNGSSGGLRLSGNYKTDQPKQTGTGWEIKTDGISDKDITAAINATPPHWAVGSAKWVLTTPEQYRADYQSSSKYTELT